MNSFIANFIIKTSLKFRDKKNPSEYELAKEYRQFVISQKRNFKNGKLEGSWIDYYLSGNLNSKGEYKNGKKEGYWVDYKEDGTLWKEYTGTYKDGFKISD